MHERLQKIISRTGLSSRRASEELIVAGRVRVNGRVITQLGTKADPHNDTIEVDGRRLVPEALRYIVLHKPRGVVATMHDPEGRPTVQSLVASLETRLYPVGRLDFATSGVLLMTNDGEFANALSIPGVAFPRRMLIKVNGLMQESDLTRWAEGVELEDGRTRPAEVNFLRHEDNKTWFELTLREGRNQQIRRMGQATGFPVMRLARTSFAGITHKSLRPGAHRPLTVDELLDLRQRFGVPKRVRGAVVQGYRSPPTPPSPAKMHSTRPTREPPRHQDARRRTHDAPGRPVTTQQSGRSEKLPREGRQPAFPGHARPGPRKRSGRT